MSTTEKEHNQKMLQRLVWLTDNSIPLPGTSYKFGIDPLLGLLPWVGDTLGAALSSYIIIIAARLGAPRSVLLKMAFNVALDAMVGALPGVGDLFDFAWKANQRNVRLLEHYLLQPRKAVVASRLFAGLLIVFMAGTVVVLGLLGFWLMRWLWLTVTGNSSW